MTMDMAARAMAKQADDKAIKQGSTKLAAADKRIFSLPNAADGALSVEGVKGKTLQNVFRGETLSQFQLGTGEVRDGKAIVLTYEANYTFVNVLVSIIPQALKPNTVYTMMFKELPFEPLNIVLRDMGKQYNIVSGYTTNKKLVFTTPSDFSNNLTIYYSKLSIGMSVPLPNNVICLEGDWTNKEVPPYFEGIKSVGEDTGKLSVKSTGKNLSPITEKNINLMIQHSSGSWGGNDGTTIVTNIPMEPNGTYQLSFESDFFAKLMIFAHNNFLDPSFNRSHGNVYGKTQSSGNGEEIGQKFVYVNSKNYKYLTITTGNSGGEKTPRSPYTVGEQIPIYIKNLQVEKAQAATTFVPYKESKIEIPLTEPLRSLPNGVSDEIKDGKIIRRVGKRILNGNEYWEYNDVGAMDGYSRYSFILVPAQKRTDTFVSSINNKMFTRTTQSHGPYEYFWLQNTSNSLFIQVNSEKVPKNNVPAFKNWLSQNNIELYYELETPKEEPITIPAINSFTNGMVTVENNLWPNELTISYSTNVVARVINAESTLNGVLASTLTLADKELAMKSISSLATAATLPDTVAKINQIINIWR